DSDPITVTITTNTVLPPTATAGQNQTVKHGATVTLSGRGSDPQGFNLTISWALINKPMGSKAALSAANSANPTFVADIPGTYVGQLIVSNTFMSSSPSTVTVTTTNTSPVANAGPNQTVTLGTV